MPLAWERTMKNVTMGFLAAGLLLSTGAAHADDKLLGIVSIAATEANNVRYIAGATAAAAEDGWTISVIDAAGSADQANSAIQNFAQRGAGAVIDMVFPASSIGAGLAAAKNAIWVRHRSRCRKADGRHRGR